MAVAGTETSAAALQEELSCSTSCGSFRGSLTAAEDELVSSVFFEGTTSFKDGQRDSNVFLNVEARLTTSPLVEGRPW